MTREDIQREVIALKGNNWLLELATSLGKSKLALEKIKSIIKRGDKPINSTLLIVIPRNVLKNNWIKEIEKWWPDCPLSITFTTYVSFPKHKGNWDFSIMDEGQHFSERCRKALSEFNISYSILCSATINKSLKEELQKVFNNLIIYKKDLREAIDNKILPDPKVILWPLNLNIINLTETVWRNTKAKGKTIECTWIKRWDYIMSNKNNPIKISCTEKQYYMDLCNNIEYWKSVYDKTRSKIAKHKWLKLCSDRLKWLSDKKLKYVFKLLLLLKKYRVLTFCNTIEQTELLSRHCINSKNSNANRILYNFNAGKINHITACNILNEGVNLVNCQIGIFANLNSSEIITKQRHGRILRHPNPIIIVPFFKNTREEKLIKTMMENYNPELIQVIETIDEIKI